VITRNVALPEYWSGFEAITGIMPFFAGIMPYIMPLLCFTNHESLRRSARAFGPRLSSVTL
jgi:hypothetical protein